MDHESWSGGGRTGADGGLANPGRLELAEDELTQAVERRDWSWWQDWRTSGHELVVAAVVPHGA